MEFWPDTDPKHQQLLAVGDANGNLHVLDVPRNLRRRVTNEEGSMKSFFLREVSRVAYVEQRMVTRAAEREGASKKEEEEEPPVKDAPAAALPSEDKEAELAEAGYLQMRNIPPRVIYHPRAILTRQRAERPSRQLAFG